MSTYAKNLAYASIVLNNSTLAGLTAAMTAAINSFVGTETTNSVVYQGYFYAGVTIGYVGVAITSAVQISGSPIVYSNTGQWNWLVVEAQATTAGALATAINSALNGITPVPFNNNMPPVVSASCFFDATNLNVVVAFNYYEQLT